MKIDKSIAEFKKYTNNYDSSEDMIKLKISHTFRVVDLCMVIAKNLNLNEEEIYISRLIGLLHDIGRFEQWKKYKTFVDRESIDHADLGVEILKKDNYIRKYIEDDKYDNIILKSILNHNKYKISNELNEKEMMFSKIIRDADKIDILYLYVTGEIDLELDDGILNENVYTTLLNRKDVSRSDLKSKTDRLSVSLGFIFDINYKESIKILKENNYINTIIDIYLEKSNNEELNKQLEEIRKVINNYIEEMLEC